MSQNSKKENNARFFAYKALCKIEKDNSYSNLELRSDVDLDERESSFYRRLVRTVIERKITLDYNISLYLTQSIKRMKPQVLTILRLGTAQLLFMDKIPQSAAVNESVKLCQSTGSAFAKNMVNAVLRKITSAGLVLPDETDDVNFLSVKYSFSPYITKKYIADYGRETAEKIMACSLDDTNIYIRKNSLNSEPLTIDAEKQDDFEFAYMVKNSDFAKSEDFEKGLFHVQDLSSQCCVLALDPHEGETIADVCASPGGKSATIAETMNNRGKVLAFDIYEHRTGLIEENMRRLGISIVKTAIRDASTGDKILADRVLCDVPCSGTGDAGKKPEVKYKTEEEFKNLPQIQLDILKNSARCVKVGGVLVYSTCTLIKDENEAVVNAFLKDNSDFEIVEMRTILPFEMKCDGFFYCKLRRKK